MQIYNLINYDEYLCNALAPKIILKSKQSQSNRVPGSDR